MPEFSKSQAIIEVYKLTEKRNLSNSTIDYIHTFTAPYSQALSGLLPPEKILFF